MNDFMCVGVCVCVLGASIWNKKGIWKKIIACCNGLGALVWSKITMQSGCEFETTIFVRPTQQSLEASHVSFFFSPTFLCVFFSIFLKKSSIIFFQFFSIFVFLFYIFLYVYNSYNLVHFACNLHVHRS